MNKLKSALENLKAKDKKKNVKGFSEGGAVMKDKIVSIDTSPNSGLITTKGFGAGRKT